ncbi:pseudouridine synthase [Lipomyces oligophaga]|uniref:pseudouridine synthase n=1 Tax=Lipomyces oligophaga TaxID=45792 RepID=UPI0034CDABF6
MHRWFGQVIKIQSSAGIIGIRNESIKNLIRFVASMSDLEPASKRIRIDSTLDEQQTESIGVLENQVGITEYLNSGKGFKGLIKQRYTDFLVNEIGLDGHVLKIEYIPTIPEKKFEQVKPKADKPAKDHDDIQAADIKAETEIRKILGEESIVAAHEILSGEKKGSFLSSVTIDDKILRGKVHGLFRAAYEGKLDTTTTKENYISFKRSSGRERGGKRHTGSGSLSIKENVDTEVLKSAGSKDKYTYFTLYKVNKETPDICRVIAKFLRRNPKSVTVAGTKDRRGVTVQRCCVQSVPLERLVHLNRVLSGTLLSDFKYHDEMLKLGDLSGNEFVITLREVVVAPDVIDSAFMALRDNGYINYYGMQRFGTFSISTHEIGKAILQQDYAAAVDLILRPQPLALRDSAAARQQYASEPDEPSKALALMPPYCVAESAVLRALVDSPSDYLGALMKIPRGLRLMFVHAYQSYVWNSVVSKRFAQYGEKIVEGDLVLVTNTTDQTKNQVNEDCQEVQEDFAEDVLEQKQPLVRALTAIEAASGNFSKYDIVMPTPGWDVIYPTDSLLLSTYETVMQNDNLDPHSMKRNAKEFSLYGGYRQVFAKPDHLEWCTRTYSSSTDELVRTDLEIAKARKENITLDRIKQQSEIPVGEKLAVVVTMRLGTAQYATIALREAMKIETSRRSDMLAVRIE